MHTPLASLARRFQAASPRTVRRLRLSRAFHSAKAALTTLDSKNSPTTRQIDIFIGDAGQSYIIFDKPVEATMAAAVELLAGSDQEKVPLKFFHGPRYFANSTASPIVSRHGASNTFGLSLDATAYPRITIEQDLPRQTETDVSSATLWLWGASHSITLDGTADRIWIRGPFTGKSPAIERSRGALEGHLPSQFSTQHFHSPHAPRHHPSLPHDRPGTASARPTRRARHPNAARHARDGNKRTALFAADMFLRLNGHRLQVPEDGNDGEPDKVLADAHFAVATGQWSAEDLGRHHASIAKPVKTGE
ncbi:hypothetical protein LLEC1_04362 [Akanthomyces lecanii]|uniref:Fido domain-containing protein n=1 Tax=Cordyceps confragosa TaxID=2714763 RepID=A0A179I7Y8_CORDF|nr:hypothetical protein LLEC1_04362 [Akanthomyces lecanii]